ncbi:MAG: sigma 54-interacting transcriptional regulator [Peptostreptococcaceae bacterium]|nr:sigma 54-interacting transcriptional regulator [Peptostreptococcaceae bacterium]
MIDKNKEIVLIAPYEDLYTKAQKLTKETPYSTIEVIQADLDEGLKIAKRKVTHGSKVIISRGGTYSLIKDFLDVSMVELKISTYDLMSSYPDLLKYKEPLAIIGYKNIISGFDLLFSCAKNTKEFEINHDTDVEALILQCKMEGIKVFAGDAVVARICKKLNLQCFIWMSSYNSIRSAFDVSLSILHAIKKEKELLNRYHSVVNHVHDGIIATDERNNIKILNNLAKKILNCRYDNIIGKNVDDVVLITGLSDKEKQEKFFIEKVCSLNGFKVSLSVLPVIVDGEKYGEIIVFQEVFKLQSLEQKIRRQLIGKGFVAKYLFSAILYKSDVMSKCLSIAQKFSMYDAPVLIEGETGVGKELFAQGIHNAGNRRDFPFVAVNCAALTPSLIESELFGYADGAFTGGIKGGKPGVFEMAHQGTLFLDEVGEIPLAMQGRLLRVIQEKEVVRIGGNEVIPLNVRLICATNCEIEKDVDAGNFRKDLFYRINTLNFTIPRLKERKSDIFLLANTFLHRFSQQYFKPLEGFDPEALSYIQSLQYEGNVRQLRGLIERAVILSEGKTVKIEDVNSICQKPKQNKNPLVQTVSKNNSLNTYLSLEEIQCTYMREVYEACNHSVSKTCSILKVSRTTLWRKINETK